jgi:hypothetical protein
MFVAMIQHHPHRTLPDFRGKFGLPHGSILSSEGASGKAGAVQSLVRVQLRAPALPKSLHRLMQAFLFGESCAATKRDEQHQGNVDAVRTTRLL